MEQYEVMFLEDAVSDLEEIMLYATHDSKKTAFEMHELIIGVAKDLSLFPKRGRLTPDKKMGEIGVRILAIGKYIMFYKIDRKIVHIHRILHGTINYPLLFEKIKNKH